MDDPIRDRCREALRRNALLSGVLEEGYRPSEDPILRDRLRAAMKQAARRRHARRFLIGLAAAAGIALFALPEPEPMPERSVAAPVAAPPVGILQIVTTEAAAPHFEIVPTSTDVGFEVVRTAQLIGPVDRARDEELLASGGVVGIVGHPGGVRKLILSNPTPHRSQE